MSDLYITIIVVLVVLVAIKLRNKQAQHTHSPAISPSPTGQFYTDREIETLLDAAYMLAHEQRSSADLAGMQFLTKRNYIIAGKRSGDGARFAGVYRVSRKSGVKPLFATAAKMDKTAADRHFDNGQMPEPPPMDYEAEYR
jgi:hypothetical protein